MTRNINASDPKASDPKAVREFRAGAAPLLGATLGLGCGVGIYTPLSSLFLPALAREFHWSRTAAAASFLALPISAVVLPIMGTLLDRFGVRVVALASSIGLAASFVGLSLMGGSLGAFYLTVLVLNVLGAGTGPIGYTRVIAADFTMARGLALSVALLGIGAANVVLPPVVAQVVAHDSWRAGYRLLAELALAGGVIACILLGGRLRTRAAPAEAAGRTLRQALERPEFWELGLAILCISIGSLGFTSQLQSIGVEKGMPPSQAAWLISLLALSVMSSRLAIGRALDKLDPRCAGATALTLAAVGALVMAFAPFGAALQVEAGVFLIGFSIGSELDLLSFFCARCFGLRRFSSIYGALSMFLYLGTALGGVGYGVVHDRTGSYTGALAASAALLLAAAALFLALPPRSWVERGLSGKQG